MLPVDVGNLVLMSLLYLTLQPRMDDSVVVPSKVLHLRNLPDNVTDREVFLLGLPFGRVANVLLLRSKSQAFLEMADSSAASTMINYYSSVPAIIRYFVSRSLFVNQLRERCKYYTSNMCCSSH